MSHSVTHPYHLVDDSPWPILASVFSMGVMVGFLTVFNFGKLFLLEVSMISITLVMYQWWRDVSREGSLMGLHTSIVELGLRLGMLLFIVSEIFFFISFFWAYFNLSLSPESITGSKWIPMNIKCFNPFGVPLLNSIILVTSGASLTWSHHSMVSLSHNNCMSGILITIILGGYFIFIQIVEYVELPFTMSDGAYGSTFFLMTGFHGMHVLVGVLFLIVTAIRISSGMLSPAHHFGLEAAAWYWHFVDVVWLFLYMSVYWWGSMI